VTEPPAVCPGASAPAGGAPGSGAAVTAGLTANSVVPGGWPCFNVRQSGRNSEVRKILQAAEIYLRLCCPLWIWG